MNNSHFFVNPVNSVQLLSIVHYINTLNDFLYDNYFLAKSDRYKPVPIVNGLFDYFDKNNDDLAIKTNLVYKLINGTDLYGGRKNEFLDEKYVDTTIDYILRIVIFSKFENIYGFFVSSLISTDNISLSFFLEHLKQRLKIAKYVNEDGSISQLSDLAADKIHERFISPLFPQAEGNINILSVDYLYAIAGLSFARAISLDLQNVTFEELIQISQIIESSVHTGQLDNTSLNIFALPAMLYFANATRNLTDGNILKVVSRPLYWSRAFQNLFSYFNSDLERAQKKMKSNNLWYRRYQYNLAMVNLKNRTQLAEENIRLHCSLEKESDYEQEVTNYKNNPVNYRCPGKGKTLQNLTKIYSDQVKSVALSKFWLEVALIEKAYGPEGISYINNMKMRIAKCNIREIISEGFGLTTHVLIPFKTNVDMLQFFDESGTHHFEGLIRYKGRDIIRINNSDPDFNEKTGIKPDTLLHCGKLVKQTAENFVVFKQRLAHSRVVPFSKLLHMSRYDETEWEKAKETLLSFVPFYNCINDIKGGRKDEATLDCLLDVLAFVPFYGKLVSTGYKILSKTLLANLGSIARSFVFKEFISMSLRTIGRGFVSEAATQSTQVLTRQTLKSLSISLLRALDPGFELIGRIGILGIRGIGRLLSLIGKLLPSALSTRISTSLSKLGKLGSKIKVGIYRGYKVFANTLLGSGAFGRRFVFTTAGKFEWRSVGSLKNVVPVKLVDESRNIYKQVKVETGVTHGLELTSKHDMLQPQVYHELKLKMNNPETEIELSEEITEEVLIVQGRGSGADLNKGNTQLRDGQSSDQVLILALNRNGIREENIYHLLRDYVLLDKDRSPMLVYKYCMQYSALPPWLSPLRINNVDLLLTLRLADEVGPNNLGVQKSFEKICWLYSLVRFREGELSVREVLAAYKNKAAYNLVKFEDFYAIAYYFTIGFDLTIACANSYRVQNAFYRLVIRQAFRHPMSLNHVTRLLYVVEATDRMFADSLTVNSQFVFAKFVRTSRKLSTVNRLLTPAEHEVQIIYHCMFVPSIFTVNMKELFLEFKGRTLLMPEAKFTIVAINKLTINNLEVRVVLLEAVRTDMSKVVANYMNRIDKLEKQGVDFYYDNGM